VDYTEGAVLDESNLDTTAQQAVFAAAKMVDRFDAVHTHSWDDISDKPAVATRWPEWGEVTEKPAQFQGEVMEDTDSPAHWDNLPYLYPYTGLIDKAVESSGSNGGPSWGWETYYVQQYMHHNFGMLNVTQLAIPGSGGEMACRRYNGWTWTPWKYLTGGGSSGDPPPVGGDPGFQ